MNAGGKKWRPSPGRTDHAPANRATATAAPDAAAALAVEYLGRLRDRLANVLHDTVVQTLVAATYLSELDETPRADLHAMLRAATTELSAVVAWLAPPAAGVHIAVSLARLPYQLPGMPPVRVAVSTSGDLGALSTTSVRALHRIAQEALANVATHAGTGAATATVSADAASGVVTLDIADTGPGFDTSQPASLALGLSLATLYAAAAGGTLEVCAAAGDGTTVRVVLPMGQPAAGASGRR